MYHKELLQKPSDRADLRIGCHHFVDENLQSNHIAKKEIPALRLKKSFHLKFRFKKK